MKIVIGADHAGFRLKDQVREHLQREGHEVEDVGTFSEASTDYPDYARAVAERVSEGKADFGVLVCSTGLGMAIAANKVHGIRAALGANEDSVRLTRAHNDANILTIGAKYTASQEAEKFADIFISTPFDGGRHERRLQKVAELEKAEHDRSTEDVPLPG